MSISHPSEVVDYECLECNASFEDTPNRANEIARLEECPECGEETPVVMVDAADIGSGVDMDATPWGEVRESIKARLGNTYRWDVNDALLTPVSAVRDDGKIEGRTTTHTQFVMKDTGAAPTKMSVDTFETCFSIDISPVEAESDD